VGFSPGVVADVRLLLGAITVGINGYRAFTQEALAATIKRSQSARTLPRTVTFPIAACTCSILPVTPCMSTRMS